MRRDVEDERIIRRYLLDDLPLEERRRLEERLLDDGDDFFEQVQLAEADLMDAYVTGEFSEDDRARFEENFLFSPERQEQLRFTELLRGHLAAEPIKETATTEAQAPSPWIEKLTLFFGLGRPAVGFAFACALILTAGLTAWLCLRAWQLSDRLDRLRAEQPTPSDPDALARLQRQLDDERASREAAARELQREQDRRGELEQELSRLKAGNEGNTAATRPPRGRGPERAVQSARPEPAGSVLAFTLVSGGVRDSGRAEPLRMTRATVTARLRLDVGAGDHESFRAALEDADGNALLARDNLRVRTRGGNRAVVFDVPAKFFRDGGDFQVTLSGLTREGAAEVIDRYTFRVERE